MRSRLNPLRLFLILAFVVAAACTNGDSGGGSQSSVGESGAYPRSETLYTTGTQWGPPHNWNPLVNWDYAAGTVGLVYETLFLYDPLADEFTPWLAESGEWTSPNVYDLTLRDGIEWTDGEAFTADDVVFTVELGQFESVPYSTLWTWLESAEAVDDLHVRFTFSQANYQEWANWIFNNAIVPEHLWADLSEEEVATGANENPIGTGPYLYESHDQDRQVWVRNDDWWGIEQLGIELAPRYVIDVVNASNSVALGRVLQGGVDMSNNFLPGVASLVEGDYGIATYYPEPPYMLSANTAWLVPNTTKAPMNDPAFRRALAFSIDTGRIVEDVYGDMVMAANSTGLLPNWDKYVDESVVNDLGFAYDPAQAKQILADAGYRDTNGDGFVEGLDGSAIELSLMVPNGWTDWMESIRVVAESAGAVGINITPEFPDYNALVDARNTGNFDLVINNDRQISNTPWTYYDYLFRLPILDTQTTVNFSRYENEQAWQLTQQLDQTPVDDIAAMQSITSQLQTIQLTDMPVIPLWYNGLWFQGNTSVWSNWPSDEGGNHYLPASWRGYYQMMGIMALAELEPAPAPEG
jgi:peptide/nickel transport system substrate-binding protein